MSRIFLKHDKQTIIHGDFLDDTLIKENSIDLIVTSPPYNVDISYNSTDDKIGYREYLNFTQKWISKCYSLAKPDGRFCLNIPLDKNKGGHQSVYADITSLAKKAGWKYFTSIVWNEGNISRRTAWGSFMSASAPYIIAPVEMIVIFYKDHWKKLEKGISDIGKKDFMDWTNGVWVFNGESKKRIGHPAPFPIELPRRCIQLFSYVGDTILDPFLGSGTTLVAAQNLSRNGIGTDIDETYCRLARNRILNETETLLIYERNNSNGTHYGVLQEKPEKEYKASRSSRLVHKRVSKKNS